MSSLDDLLGERDLPTAEETLSFGEKIGRNLRGGEVILAYGSMGAGKTCLAQGVARGLGIKRVVNSPTFNMVKVYRGSSLTFYHVDAYRLEDASENRDIGLWDFLGDRDGVTYIEWPEYVLDDIQGVGECLRIDIRIRDDGSRSVEVKLENV